MTQKAQPGCYPFSRTSCTVTEPDGIKCCGRSVWMQDRAGFASV
ncbi:hypothetical protein OKW42_006267 [Paraburkholderia sp. WC7.3d]